MEEPFAQAWSTIRVIRDGPLVEVSLHRPDARNALDATLMAELTSFARAVRRRSDVLAVILTGDADYFSAGADLSARRERDARRPTLLERREAVMAGPDLCQAWEDIEAVTICAVEGYCIGGGCALALACDWRILGQGAYFRLPEVPLGMNMSWTSVPRLTTLIGPARAKRFVIFGEAADAATALAWGMADDVAGKGEALETARAWARKVCALPPLPVRMTKAAVNAQATALHQASGQMDRDQFLLASGSADYREGVKAFFEKRPGNFKGD